MAIQSTILTQVSYASIQAAIDADETLDGHTISVEEGIYYEHVVVGKKLTLTGENRDTTIVDGNGTGPWFCKVIIPNAIIHDSWGDNCTLIINGQLVEPSTWADESNAYIYFTIPEFTSFHLTLLLMASTILTIIIFRRKLCLRP